MKKLILCTFLTLICISSQTVVAAKKSSAQVLQEVFQKDPNKVFASICYDQLTQQERAEIQNCAVQDFAKIGFESPECKITSEDSLVPYYGSSDSLKRHMHRVGRGDVCYWRTNNVQLLSSGKIFLIHDTNLWDEDRKKDEVRYHYVLFSADKLEKAYNELKEKAASEQIQSKL